MVVRSTDTLPDLIEKVKLATIIGTLQSSLTNFRYLRNIWKKNTEEECLLGVSLTGICDHPVLGWPDSIYDWTSDGGLVTGYDWLIKLKEVAIETNKEWANLLGLNQSVAITCVKPSGTVSQLVDSSSGIHPRFAPYYIRTVRADKKDPLAQFMIDQGFPCEPDVMKPDHQLVFSFPQKAPEGAMVTKDVGAMTQMNQWLSYQEAWCEHKPSITVYYKDSEFLELGAFVYDKFDKISGVSFLPYSDHTYQQAPYQEVTEAQYNEWVGKMPKGVDWSLSAAYDRGEDKTEGVQMMACSSGVCEI